MGFMTIPRASGAYVCDSCYAAPAQERKQALQESEAALQRIKEASEKIIVTTTHNIDGCYVTAYLGVESVEFVIGTGLFSEMTSDFSDLFGLRSSAFESKLQTAKRTAMEAIKFIAAEKGAHAIIGLDLDYTEFSGNRVGLIMNGTLVRLARIKPNAAEPQPKRNAARAQRPLRDSQLLM
jgi:uncharacterized protein YbjQ (UPF0145 family)